MYTQIKRLPLILILFLSATSSIAQADNRLIGYDEEINEILEVATIAGFAVEVSAVEKTP
jgi:hypothetical protein